MSVAESHAPAFTGTNEERALIEQAVLSAAQVVRRAPRKLLVCTLSVHNGKVGPGHPSITHGNLPATPGRTHRSL